MMAMILVLRLYFTEILEFLEHFIIKLPTQFLSKYCWFELYLDLIVWNASYSFMNKLLYHNLIDLFFLQHFIYLLKPNSSFWPVAMFWFNGAQRYPNLLLICYHLIIFCWPNKPVADRVLSFLSEARSRFPKQGRYHFWSALFGLLILVVQIIIYKAIPERTFLLSNFVQLGLKICYLGEVF
jgi:hypothetical protein